MRYRLPEGCVGVSIAGASLDPTSDGLVEADAAAAEHLAPHGVLPAEKGHARITRRVRAEEAREAMISAVDLTTLAAVKQWLGLTSTVDDATIGSLVTAVSQAVLADLGRGGLLPATYTETLDGEGRTAIGLRQWRVTRILSLAVDGAAVPASTIAARAGYVLDAADPVPPGTMQRLHYRGGAFPRGAQRVTVTYRAGYEIVGEAAQVPPTSPYVVAASAPFGSWRLDTGLSGAAGPYDAAAGIYTFTAADAGRTVTISYGYIPNDLAQATIEWVADRYATRGRIGQAAKTLGGQETTSFIVKAMPDVVDRLLRPYRRVTP